VKAPAPGGMFSGETRFVDRWFVFRVGGMVAWSSQCSCCFCLLFLSWLSMLPLLELYREGFSAEEFPGRIRGLHHGLDETIGLGVPDGFEKVTA